MYAEIVQTNFLHHDQQLSHGCIINMAIYNYAFCLVRGALECITKYHFKSDKNTEI